MREPEPETIARAGAGDLDAFESIVRAYQADVWRFAYHLTRDRSAADDVTQEAFLHAYRAMGSFRGEAKFTSWLMRIVRNCAIDSYRKARRHAVPLDPDDAVAGRDRAAAGPWEADPASGAGQDRARIHDAIRRLPVELREPFVVIEVLGFNYEETSAILGMKVGTVKSRMHRARTVLMAALAEEAADEV